ncbi:hypothetical protein SDRG_03937 [Saprolegnia diclina VS20]|uniref:Uncharacterized protein n=1 Tax=Saprolegnia diclina (strain VS20) TaxID=1156394 RepID=T0QLS1_SAPDV|nr:hypothetical protein SDRG_03937 [Saprolegnia diclina VS20]EQC38984.1 hypothetical protein SDRG_03937 [Saprolegnia diclina VS20]|eukprot:XP_008607808.1 hypothetical protein SDRG_03937 [Saprolegnia diclina VS20]
MAKAATPTRLPPHVAATIMRFVDTSTTLLAVLDALSSASPFFIALRALATVVPPWMLWRVLDVNVAVPASRAHPELFKCVLAGHPNVFMDVSDAPKYARMLLPEAKLTMVEDACDLAKLDRDLLAQVTTLFVFDIRSLPNVVQLLAYMPRLRLELNASELEDDAAVAFLLANTSANVRCMEMTLPTEWFKMTEATAMCVATVLPTLPLTALTFKCMLASEDSAKGLHDALQSIPTLRKLRFEFPSSLACGFAACAASKTTAFPQITVFPMLGSMGHLHDLHIDLGSPLDDEGFDVLMTIVEALPLHSLSQIGLLSSRVRVIAFKSALSTQSTVRTLSLDFVWLKPEGLDILASLIMPHIEHLDLCYNYLTDDNIMLLVGLVAASNLRSLWLASNDLSVAGKEKLRRYVLTLPRGPCHLRLDEADAFDW